MFLMAGTITALKIQKHNKERVNIYLDDKYALAVTAIVAATLTKGQYLTDAEIEQLRDHDERDKAYEQSIRFLGYRARSQAEVERHLQQKGYSPEAVSETVNRLLAQHYLDDEAFARTWLNDRQRFRPRSQQALRYELRQKGVAEEVISTALSDLDETELAWAAMKQKLFQWQHLSEDDFKKKALGYLGRRGFNYELARTVTERAWTALNSAE
jgi:regulatory protein